MNNLTPSDIEAIVALFENAPTGSWWYTISVEDFAAFIAAYRTAQARIAELEYEFAEAKEWLLKETSGDGDLGGGRASNQKGKSEMEGFAAPPGDYR